jgi:serine/threonine protein kinase
METALASVGRALAVADRLFDTWRAIEEVGQMQIGMRVTQGENEYELVDLLAAGGFGEAYLAKQTKPVQRSVVVKAPKASIVTDPIWSKKFAREARILANIVHPNVVKVIAFWEFVDQQGKTTDMALVQELVPGAKQLDEYLQAHPQDAVSVFLQTMYALRAFHVASNPSIVHRDLSPRNILISDRGVVKVIDFGLSKEDPRATQVLTQTGEWFERRVVCRRSSCATRRAWITVLTCTLSDARSLRPCNDVILNTQSPHSSLTHGSEFAHA